MLAERLTAQLLAGPPAPAPLAVTRHLLAVQAQDPRGARLAIRVRATTSSAADVDRAMSVDRSLLVSWLNRGTLHLVSSDDYPWLHALTTPVLFKQNARRLAQDGISEATSERALKAIRRALSEEGPLTRAVLRERLTSAGVRTEGQALVHLLMRASLHGLLVRGPMIGRQHAFVLVEDWLGKLPRVDRDSALAELARRYLKGHGPAGERDLAKWGGVRLGDARAGLNAIASQLQARADGLVDLVRRVGAAQPPPPRLLGAFDPLLMGWTSRESVLGRHEARVVQGGLLRPFALVRGRGAGTWKLVGDQLELEPFVRLTAEQRAALEQDGEDVRRFLGMTAPDGDRNSAR